MSRSRAGLEDAISRIRKLKHEFWNNVRVLGEGQALNQNLEYAGRVADFLEFGELLAKDALERNESCGGHFREEYQTVDNDTLRDDANYQHVAAWEYRGSGSEPTRHTENLEFHEVAPSTRSYKAL